MSTVRCALVAGMISLGSPPVWAQGGEPDSVVYVLSAASRFEVKTGKAGLFGFAGHAHLIRARGVTGAFGRSEEHTSELQSRLHLVCRLLLEKKKKKK